MRTRPHTKFVVALTKRRCTKCGTLMAARLKRCKRCATVNARPKSTKSRA